MNKGGCKEALFGISLLFVYEIRGSVSVGFDCPGFPGNCNGRQLVSAKWTSLVPQINSRRICLLAPPSQEKVLPDMALNSGAEDESIG